MNICKRSIALVAVGLLSMSSAVMAAEMTGGCGKSGAPERIEAKVVKIDPAQEKITVRDTNGTIHEFQASKETLQDYKIGDPIKAKLRCDK